jgi:predicted nucleic acid-binding protein
MIPPLPFLDTNVILRHLLQDDPDQSPRATAYLLRVERGEVAVETADTVVFETVFTLERRHRRAKAAIRDQLLDILALPGVVLPGKSHLGDVFDLYVHHNIAFADAYHVVQMRRRGLTEIISFDREYDRVPGITRIEP